MKLGNENPIKRHVFTQTQLDSSILHFSFVLSLRPPERLPNITAIVIVIVIIFSTVTVFALCISRRANHAPKASAIQVIHSVHTVGTFQRIRADPS